MAGAIVGSDKSWLTELDNESFKKLILLNRSARLSVEFKTITDKLLSYIFQSKNRGKTIFLANRV